MPRKRKHRSPEYSLQVFHHFDDRLRQMQQVFLIQTLKEFTSFEYEILLDLSMDERIIELKILGLRTTDLIMPGVGPAHGNRELTNLHGVYDVHVIKLDGEMNQFHLGVSTSEIALKGLSPNPFVFAIAMPAQVQKT